MLTLIDRLTHCLGQPGKTKAGLARACEIKQPSVSDWMSGRTKKLEGSNLLRAATYLGVNPEWLATGLGPMRSTDVLPVRISPAAEIDPDDAALLSMLKALRPSRQKAIRAMIEDEADQAGHAIPFPESPPAPKEPRRA